MSGQATLLLPDHSEMPPSSQQNARVNCGHKEDDKVRARADPLPRFAEWQQVARIGASHRVQVVQPDPTPEVVLRVAPASHQIEAIVENPPRARVRTENHPNRVS